MTPRTLTAKTPSDLLAMVPCVLGFHPEESLVLMTFGEGGRSCHARVDLPPPEERTAVARHLAHVVAGNGGRRVAVLAYTDDPALAVAVTEPLLACLADRGIEVVAALRADGSRWFVVGAEGPGVPYDVRAHAFAAEAVYDGRVIHRDREEVRISLRGSDPAATAAVAAAADAATDRLRSTLVMGAGGAVDPTEAQQHLLAEALWVEDRVAACLDNPHSLSAEEVGRLVLAVLVEEVREVALAAMTRENARACIELWRDVLRRTPEDLVAAPATLLAFAAWLSGDGALAWCALDRCQEVEPDYPLADLLAQALTNALPPSTWQPPDRSELTLFAS